MIYFQLHYSPALWHMVLSITLARTEQKPSARERERESNRDGEKERKKIREERQRGAEKSCGD